MPEQVLLNRQRCTGLERALYAISPSPPIRVTVMSVHQDARTGRDRDWCSRLASRHHTRHDKNESRQSQCNGSKHGRQLFQRIVFAPQVGVAYDLVTRLSMSSCPIESLAEDVLRMEPTDSLFRFSGSETPWWPGLSALHYERPAVSGKAWAQNPQIPSPSWISGKTL